MSNQKRVFLAFFSVLIGMGLGVLILLANRPKVSYVSPYVPGATPPPVPMLSPEPILATPVPSPPTEPGKGAGSSVTFYRVVETSEGPALRPETRELGSEKLSDQARIAAAIAAMTEGEPPVLPKGTRLLRLKMEGTVALLDLSKELKDNFSGGDKAEQLVVNALTATVGQLSNVQTVQIFIEGASVETLGGSQSLLEPLKVPKAPKAP